MKKTFNEASVKVVKFASQDIITTSGGENEPIHTPNNDYVDVNPTPQPVIPD